MKRAPTIEDFTADPIGRFSLGATHLVWCYSSDLCGTAHWGRPNESDAAELVRRLDVSIHPALASGFDALMDARAMEAFGWPAFGVVSSYVKGRIAPWAGRIRRHAVVVPPGIVGVFVAGLIPLLGPNHPLRFFSSMAAAIGWLDRPELLGVLDEIQPLVEEARGVDPLVRSLREYLARSLVNATVEDAAHALGLSTRSLQRELRKNGTGFARELSQTRVRVASEMLEHSDEKIESIARTVGYVSSSQLSSIFRRQLGETPAEYRARRRAPRPE